MGPPTALGGGCFRASCAFLARVVARTPPPRPSSQLAALDSFEKDRASRERAKTNLFTAAPVGAAGPSTMRFEDLSSSSFSLAAAVGGSRWRPLHPSPHVAGRPCLPMVSFVQTPSRTMVGPGGGNTPVPTDVVLAAEPTATVTARGEGGTAPVPEMSAAATTASPSTDDLSSSTTLGTKAVPLPAASFGSRKWYLFILASVVFTVAVKFAVWYNEELKRRERHKSIVKDIAREKWRRDVLRKERADRDNIVKRQQPQQQGKGPGGQEAASSLVTARLLSHGDDAADENDDDGFATRYLADERNQTDLAEALDAVGKDQRAVKAYLTSGTTSKF